MGLYPPRPALWSSNQSVISQRDWGFLTVQGGVDPRKLGLVDGSFRDMEWSLDRRWDPISSRGGAGSTRTMTNQKIGRWSWGFRTLRGGINLDDIRVRPRVVGIVDVWMDSDPGM